MVKRSREDSSASTIAVPQLRPCSKNKETFICVRFKDKEAIVWYGLSLSCDNGDTKQRKKKVRRYDKIPESSIVHAPIWETETIPRYSRISGLGSTIYSLGSHPHRDIKFSREVRYADAACPEKGWMLAPPMKSRRLFGQAVTLQGKIYVFGGVRKVSLRKPWGEVFDPKKNEWRALTGPPANFPSTKLYVRDLFALALGDVKIVAGSLRSGGLFAYTPSSDSWETVDEHFSVMLAFSTLAIVGRTMYWVGREVHAYNFDLKRTCTGRING